MEVETSGLTLLVLPLCPDMRLFARNPPASARAGVRTAGRGGRGLLMSPPRALLTGVRALGVAYMPSAAGLSPISAGGKGATRAVPRFPDDFPDCFTEETLAMLPTEPSVGMLAPLLRRLGRRAASTGGLRRGVLTCGLGLRATERSLPCVW